MNSHDNPGNADSAEIRPERFLAEIRSEGLTQEVEAALLRFCEKANVMTLEYLTRVFLSGIRPDLHVSCDDASTPVEIAAVSIITFQQEAPTLEFLEVSPRYRGKGFASSLLNKLKQKYRFIQALYPTWMKGFMEHHGFKATTSFPIIHNGLEFCYLGLYSDANAGIETLH